MQQRTLFRIGFAPDSWDFATGLLKRKQFRPEIATAAGACSQIGAGGRGSYDLFRGRLMFPIHDMQDRPISMGGRVIPEIAARHGDRAGGKYINGPETKLFRKSQQLYGLQIAREAIRKSGQALVMEGYTDVIAAHQAGIEPVVAVLGTALGEGHVKLLKRLAQRVVLVLDGDAAGQRRADEVLELFVRADADLRVLTLPEGMDPADFLTSHGRAAMEKLIDAAPDALEHKLNSLTDGLDLTNDTHAVMQAIDTMTGILAKSTALDPLKQDQILLRLSRTFGIATDRLEQRLEQKRREEKNKAKATSRFRSAGNAPSARLASGPASDSVLDPNQLLAEAAEMDSQLERFSSEPTGQALASSDSYPPAESQPLSGFDRELFEIMIESPDVAGLAVEAIDPDWLESLIAKMLLSAYQQLDLMGRDLNVESLMLLLENDTLKNEVVTLQFRLSQRSGKSVQSPQSRFTSVLQRYQERTEQAEKRRQIAQLETSTLDEIEELELLKQLFESEKHRQQIDQ